MQRFMLDNSLAATSALIKDGNIYAADGKECNAHIFDTCGNYSRRIPTARAYDRFRYSENGNFFTALGCGCDERIYCLDERLTEIGFTELRYGCNRFFNYGAMTDVSSLSIGSERYFVAAFERGSFLFDPSGNPIRQLCKTETGETLTDFIAFGEENFAFATRKCGFTVITVSEKGDDQSALLDGKLSLRMLFSRGDCIYGLFGYSYIYNRIALIYTDGVLSLPKAIENCKAPC